MEYSAVRSALISHIESAALPPAGTARAGLSVLGRILDGVKALLASLKDTVTPEIKQTIEKVALELFDAYVVLPEPLDTMSDNIAKMLLDRVLGV